MSMILKYNVPFRQVVDEYLIYLYYEQHSKILFTYLMTFEFFPHYKLDVAKRFSYVYGQNSIIQTASK